MSYGQVGFEAGVSPRRVGWAMAVAGDAADVPWHRVVGAHGDLKIAARSAVLGQMQRDMLVGEGVAFLENGLVDMDLYRVGAPDGI
jgi:alkylated DNA nucleotide flippase Atl1